MTIDNLKTIERIVLKDSLHAEHGLLASSFWVRYRIDPRQLINGIKSLLRNNILSLDGARIEITDKGREFVENCGLLAMDNQTMGGGPKCPEQYSQPQLTVNEPILPMMRLVDKAILPEATRRKLG